MNTALFRLFIKLDYRNREDKGFRRLIGIIVSYLIANGIISFNNYRYFDCDSFLFVSYTMNIFLMAFIVVNDYPNLFFAKSQIQFLKHLPVSENIIFSSKFFSAFIYLSAFPVIIALPQAIFVSLYGISVLRTLQFFVSIILYAYMFAGITILLYSMVVYFARGKSKIILYLMQFGFFILIFLLSGYGSAARLSGVNVMTNDYAVYFPQYWFVMSNYNFVLFVSLAAVTVIIYYVLYSFMRARFTELSDILAEIDTGKNKHERKRSFKLNLCMFESIILKKNAERASFYLIKNNFNNSSNLKLRMIPVVFIPVAMTLIAVISGIPSMLMFQENNMPVLKDGIIIIGPSVSIVLIMFVRLLIANTKMQIEGTSGIDWLYESLPFASQKEILSGVNKFIYLYFLMPVLIVMFALLSIRLNPADTALNLIYAFSFISFADIVYLAFDRQMPFTAEISKSNSAGKYLNIFLVVLLGVVFFVSQIFVFENAIFVFIAVFLFLVLTRIIKAKLK